MVKSPSIRSVVLIILVAAPSWNHAQEPPSPAAPETRQPAGAEVPAVPAVSPETPATPPPVPAAPGEAPATPPVVPPPGEQAPGAARRSTLPPATPPSGPVLASLAEQATAPGGVMTPKTMTIRLSLEEAIRWAIRKNLEILADNLNVDIARREVVIARSAFDPFFNVGVTYSKNRDPTINPITIGNLNPVSMVLVNPSNRLDIQGDIRGLTPIGTTYQVSLIESRISNPRNRFNAFDPTYSTRAVLTVTQPLLKDAWYPFNSANIRIAENTIGIERQNLELTSINTLFAVEAAYWDLVFAYKNFESKARALELAQENLRISERKVEVGTLAPVGGLTVAQSLVARRKTEYDAAAALFENARETLLQNMNYIGTTESLKTLWVRPEPETPYKKYSDILVIPTTEPIFQEIEPDRPDAIRAAFANRPEFRQIELQIQNQEIAVRVARNQLLPALDLIGSWYQLGLDRSYSSSIDRMLDGDFYDWSFGASFEVPLSYRGPRATFRNARDRQARLHLQKQSLENTIVIEIDRAIRDLKYAYRDVVNLQRQVDLQQELVRAEELKASPQVGIATQYDVLLIQNDLVAFQAQLLRALADFQIAKAAYDRAQGKLIQKWGLQIFD